VALITETEGPPGTHVRLDRDAGVTGYDVSYVNTTDLHSIAKPRLRHQRARLALPELESVENALRDYLGL
jgi:mRNA interferase MazF